MTCNRCGTRIPKGDPAKRGAYGYAVLCLDCYAELKDWSNAELGN